MYKHYYLNLNADKNGNHEVHDKDCYYLSLTTEKEYLGYFDNCQDAIREAKAKHPSYLYKVDGCYYCSKSCHRG